MNRKHFEQARSAIDKEELLDCVAAVGLDTEAARAFLNTDELRDVVWQSYGATIRDKNIHSIPLFVFNVPSIGAVGGPFRARAAREPHILNVCGSDAPHADTCVHLDPVPRCCPRIVTGMSHYITS